jgi:hypothetical protein
MGYEKMREEIEGLGLSAIQEFFKVDTQELDKDTLHAIHAKAKLAMSFEREINVSKRAVELNYIRVFRMIADDKAELRKFVKKSLPKYYPV